MPENKSWIDTLIGVGGNIVTGAVNGLMQKRVNSQQRQYEVNMYNLQKHDARKFWKMENEYNTPAMQMQRLKEAGLNPNLMYGSPMSGGNAGNLSAPNANLSQAKAPQIENPVANISPIAAMYDLQQKGAQTNLLQEQVETQNTVQELNAVNASLNTIKSTRESTAAANDKQRLDQEYQNLIATQQDIVAGIRLKHSTSRATDATTKRENQLQPGRLKQQVEEILNKRASTANLGTQSSLNISKNEREQIGILLDKIDVEMAEKGLSRNDSGLDRALKLMIGNITDKLDSPMGPITGGGILKPIIGFLNLLKNQNQKNDRTRINR